MKKYLKYILLALAIVIALGMTFYQNLDYSYEMQGDAYNILETAYAGCSGYEVIQGQYEDGTTTFTAIAEDPQFYLSGIGMLQPLGGIEIVLAKPFPENTPVPVQIFYTVHGENTGSYSEKNSVKGEIEQGRTSCRLPLPWSVYSDLRIDIDGDFTISGVYAYTEETKITPVVSHRTIKNCMMYFPAIIIGFCLIFWAHSVKAKGMTAKAYAKDMFFGPEVTAGRQVHLDYLRILAAVLVILAHACSPMVDLADASWKRFVLVCGLSIGLCCNLIYVMLSGNLLLSSKKEEKVSVFYLRRASKVIIPLIAYYMLLLVLGNEVSLLPPKNIGAAFKRIMTGAPDVGPHLWLIYTIIALYFVTPFFRVMVQNLSTKMLFALAAVILVLNALTIYLPIFGMSFGATSFLAGWEGVFLLGFIMTRKECRKYDNKIIGIGLIALVITIGVVFLDSTKMNYVYNNALTLILVSCAIYAIFLKFQDKFQGKSNLIVRMCSKYSYAIILIHWYALFVVVQGKLHITALRFGCIGGIGATVVVTFLVCLAMGILYDNTVVIVCNVLFEKIVEAIAKITHKKK
ncbi:MAG: acyltransferase [Lachnospiraceae bacterium]|nr:acyltransferase [Lachnospiraceae bacterium]